MIDRIDGTVWQAKAGKPVLEWGSREAVPGNCLKFSRIRAAETALDTSKIQLCLPLDGPETYWKAGQHVTIGPTEYFILNKGQEARVDMQLQTAVEGFCIFLTEKTLAEVHAVANRHAGQLLDSPDIQPGQRFEFFEKNYSLRENALGAYLQQTKQQLRAPSGNRLIDWDRFYYKLAESLLDTQQRIEVQLQAIGAAKLATRQEIFRRVSRAHNYIQEHFAQPLALDEIACHAHFSPYHLIRLYHQVYGITPHQQILTLRTHRAMELLRLNYSPTEIAYMLSFSDRRAFAKVFKKMTHLSPAAFQRAGEIPVTDGG